MFANEKTPLMIRLLFMAVVADIRVFRTVSRNTALPILFMQEQTSMGDFNPADITQ